MANAAMAKELPEYVENLRALLRLDLGLWRVVVERQILATLLPHLSGNRVELETHLWALLIICLDGHEAPVPTLSDVTWDKAIAAVKAGRSLANTDDAVFPRAARGLVEALITLRETGIFPRPLVPNS